MANDYDQNNPSNNPAFQSVPPPNLPTEPANTPQQNTAIPTPPPMPPPPPPEPVQNLNRVNISRPEPQTVSAPPPPPPQMPNPMPPYPAPLPDFKVKKERQGNSSIAGIVVLIIAIIVIVGLAFLLYYYATKPSTVVPVDQDKTVTPVKKEEVKPPPVNPTKVITFKAPDVLPKTQVSGNCVVSIAEPYRIDSYRCTVGKKIYDPCLSIGSNNLLYCQMDPTASETTGILVKNIKVLPKLTAPATLKDNWGWYVKLRDGTFCSPFTGTNFSGAKPIVNGKAALYGCRSLVAGEQVLIIGDLIKGEVWKAQKSIVTKQGTSLVQKAGGLVDVDTVWQ